MNFPDPYIMSSEKIPNPSINTNCIMHFNAFFLDRKDLGRKEKKGKEINSFVWLGGIGVKERKMKETNSSMAHHILSSQIGRKMREKREYLWWDPPIRCVSLHFSLTNQTGEKKNFILSLPIPLPSLPPFPFPFPFLPFALPNTV